MREFTKSIKGIQRGLRAYADAPVNTEGLARLRNAKCTATGLRDWLTPTAAFSAGELIGASVTIAPPFPQFMKGITHTFLATPGFIYEVNPLTWTLTQLIVYDGYNTGLQSSILMDGVWDFVDFGGSYMFFNGTNWLYKTGHAEAVGELNKVFTVTVPSINTACRFNGHAVYGGFAGTVFNQAWEAMLRRLVSTDSGLAASFTDIGPNYVWWTSAAGGDLLWLIYPELAFSGFPGGTYTEDLPFFVQHFQRGDCGFMRLDFDGAVLRTVPFGNAVYAFGEDGVCVMPWSRELLTFGKELLEIPPILQRGAVCASQRELIYIDRDHQLWRLNSEGFTLLGYDEHLAGLTGTINIHYDDNALDFYIVGGNKCFVYNTFGLSEVGRLVTGVVNGYTPLHVGVFAETGVAGAEDTVMEIVTSDNDAGIRAKKTIVQIEVSMELLATQVVDVAIDYKDGTSSIYKRTRFVRLNSEGIAQLPVNCHTFRIIVRAANYKTVKVDEIKYAVQYDDGRTVYGIETGDAG